MIEVVGGVMIGDGVERRPERVADQIVGIRFLIVRDRRVGHLSPHVVAEHVIVAQHGLARKLWAVVPHLVLDVRKLRIMLVVLLVLRAIDSRVKCSFHGWWFCRDVIAGWRWTYRQSTMTSISFVEMVLLFSGKRDFSVERG